MELILNLAWAVLAFVLVCFWLQSRTRNSHGGHGQIAALAVLIAILLPVISVSDDLLAIQNATEVDACQRRDHMAQLQAHTLVPVMGVVPAAAFATIGFNHASYVSPARASSPSAEHPELSGIENRPPPAA